MFTETTNTPPFTEIPNTRPVTPLLDQAKNPQGLRQIPESDLPKLANELREYLLYTVGKTGGHFGAGLGVVELTVALHHVFNTPSDRLVWDVGHQAYPHKILTERRDLMHTLRQREGIGAFPNREESHYDTFGVGHSSTSISAAMGMALGSKMDHSDREVVAIIGDGAMTAGMAFEALNHAGHEKSNMLVVLNDNRMSISENVGGLSNYFARIWASRRYNALKEKGKKVLENMPHALDIASRTEEHMKGMVAPGTLFEELGFNYIGPLNGHDLPTLLLYLKKLKDIKGPRLLHIITQKGKGFAPAEADPIGYHALNKIDPTPSVTSAPSPQKRKPSEQELSKPVLSKSPVPTLKYSAVFGQWLCDMAERDPRLVGITPAMSEGSGMVDFSLQYPDQYYDVAIAEQHAVTLAAGLACENQKPIVAIYSTFLQRAYDQLIHDVALQNLDVLFAIDRAGLVGEDGPSHAGSFDLSFLRCVPNMVIMAPSDENECRQMLYTGYTHEGPACVRYPRGKGPGTEIQKVMECFPIGKALTRRKGSRVAILAFGSMVYPSLEVGNNFDFTVIDMRFVKPLDEELIINITREHDLIVTVEENTISGGAGAAVNEFLAKSAITRPLLNLGLPDYFVGHGKPSELLEECGLNAKGIEAAILERLEKVHLVKQALS
ncbi:MAG: 1-deoxy-D-xylulose-5-phosphate synthase [Pseudomonadales bacterium]|nr:1-deoxy-D-xylulose-5-phosphate synthase [Pseudomonadales bacterium]